MTTKERYTANYKPGRAPLRPVTCLAEFIEAVSIGADIFKGEPHTTVEWCSENGGSDFEVLSRMGWRCSTDYPRYGIYPFTVWSPFTEENRARCFECGATADQTTLTVANDGNRECVDEAACAERCRRARER